MIKHTISWGMDGAHPFPPPLAQPLLLVSPQLGHRVVWSGRVMVVVVVVVVMWQCHICHSRFRCRGVADSPPLASNHQHQAEEIYVWLHD